ncbi:hypothetical protein DFH29DRAFT_302623 [Suillus ampliporus]|nr:hypothetical protein DFH29DRAFT_302623 [Suillus ampliporus]
MWGTCGKSIFTTFWPDSLGFNIEWSPGYDVALQRWMAPCTWDEIFTMSTLTAGRHDAELLRWTYAHFGSNAHICLQASRRAGYANYYVDKLVHAHDTFWNLHPTLRELESQYNRSLFAVQPGDTRTEPLPYPVSQVASKLIAEKIVSLYPSTAKEAIDTFDSPDTREEGKILYRQTMVALMSRFGGTFEFRCPDSQWHYQPSDEGFFLRANFKVTHQGRWAYRTQGPTCAACRELPVHSPFP